MSSIDTNNTSMSTTPWTVASAVISVISIAKQHPIKTIAILAFAGWCGNRLVTAVKTQYITRKTIDSNQNINDARKYVHRVPGLGNLSKTASASEIYHALIALPVDQNTTELNFQNLGITSFFPEFFNILAKKFPNLTALQLNHNQLTALPDSIGNLSQLHTLDLNGNRLTELPETIGNLSLLTTLYLGNNQLAELPETIGNLSLLTTLYL
ncbi:hypothetical protein COB21_05970, partial [Candidatus Aerophobetes bacterium]